MYLFVGEDKLVIDLFLWCSKYLAQPRVTGTDTGTELCPALVWRKFMDFCNSSWVNQPNKIPVNQSLRGLNKILDIKTTVF